MARLLIALAIGIGAGFLSGLFGVGGGVLIVPALILLLGMNATQAIGTSLGSLLLPVGIFAVVHYAREGYVDFKVALVLAVAVACSAPFAARIATSVASGTLTRVFGFFLVVVGVRFILFP
ncbi:MAG: sulfite exporter TauE/SafE family protein [Actinomycetota bacterium]|nr:sulfite exporter TauE/SafE family protein [Actinomycetota bacterium]